MVKLRMRAMASAVLFLIANLIGLGLGPQAVGLLNDLLAGLFGAEAVRCSSWASLRYGRRFTLHREPHAGSRPGRQGRRHGAGLSAPRTRRTFAEIATRSRGPMLGTVRRIPTPPVLVALLATTAGFVAACATSVKVDVDENEDFSQYRTWDWMPQIRPRVEGRYAVTPALDVRMSRLIEDALEARGFERTQPPADFYVTFHLTIQPKAEFVEQPMAPYLLDSHHASPSFWIEGTESVERRYDDLRLAIGISGGGGRMTWQAALEQQVEAGEALPLDKAVAKLIDRFPSTGPPADSAAKH